MIARRQATDDLWTKPNGLSHKPAYKQLINRVQRRRLLLLSQKADTPFTLP